MPLSPEQATAWASIICKTRNLPEDGVNDLALARFLKADGMFILAFKMIASMDAHQQFSARARLFQQIEERLRELNVNIIDNLDSSSQENLTVECEKGAYVLRRKREYSVATQQALQLLLQALIIIQTKMQIRSGRCIPSENLQPEEKRRLDLLRQGAIAALTVPPQNKRM